MWAGCHQDLTVHSFLVFGNGISDTERKADISGGGLTNVFDL